MTATVYQSGSITAGSNVFYGGTQDFTVADRGQYVSIPGAAALSGTLVTTIIDVAPAGNTKIAILAAAAHNTVYSVAWTESTGPGVVVGFPTNVIYASGGDDLTQIQTALTSGSAAILGPGNFLVSAPIVIRSGNVLVGSGVGTTTITLMGSANCSVIESLNFQSLSGGGTSGGVAGVEIGGFTINGARTTNTGPNSKAGHGIALYGRRLWVHDVYITQCYRTGLWTEYASGGSGVSPYDGHIAHITVDTVGEHGWWNGVSDIHFNDLNIRGAGQNANNTYDGIISPSFAIHGTNVNVWGRSFFAPLHRYSMNLGGSGSTVAGLHLETGYSANLNVVGNFHQVQNFFAYNLPSGGTPVGVIVGGSGNYIQGVVQVANGTAAGVGVQVGTAANNASGNTIVTYVSGYQNGLYDFTYDTGTNILLGPNALASGTAKIGNVHFNDTAFLIGTGGSAVQSGRISTASGGLSQGFTTLGAFGQHNVAMPGSFADQSSTTVIPGTGFSNTIPNFCSSYIIDPAGTLATGTIIMPASALTGLIVVIRTTQTLTSLTVSANTGQTIKNAPTTLAAGKAILAQIVGTVWYCSTMS